jgi:predicted nucleotidyltransferase
VNEKRVCLQITPCKQTRYFASSPIKFGVTKSQYIAPLIYLTIQSGRIGALSRLYRRLYQWQALRTGRELLQLPQVCEVYLHGSAFRGDFNPGVSDLDFVVEVRDETPQLHEQIQSIFRRRRILPIHCDYSVIPQSGRFHEFRLGSIFSQVVSVSNGRTSDLSPQWRWNRLTASRVRFLVQTYRKLYRFAKLGSPSFRMERVLRLRINRFEMVASDVLQEHAARTSFAGAHDPFVGSGKTFSEFFYDSIDSINQKLEKQLGSLSNGERLQLHSHVSFEVAPSNLVRSAVLTKTYLVPPGIGSLLKLFAINQPVSKLDEEFKREILNQHALLMSNRLRRYTLSGPQSSQKLVEWLQMWTSINEQLCPSFNQTRAAEIIANCRLSVDNDWVRNNFNTLIDIFEQPFFTDETNPC